MRFVAAALALAVAGCATTPNAPLELKSIADDVWARQLERDPAARARLGMPVEQMPDPSYQRAADDAAFARRTLERLNRIDPKQLGENDRLTFAILKWREQMAIDGLQHFWLRSPVTPYNSAARATALIFKQKDLRGDYLKLLDGYARYIDALTAVVREQQRRGILLPKAEVPMVRGMFAAMRRDPESSPFFRDVPGAREAISNRVNAALDRLVAVLGPEYDAAAPSAVGIGQYPGGAAAYRYLIRLETSFDLSPEEIHQLGLSEVARLEKELDAVRIAVGFQGSLAEFHQFLKTDKRFFEPSPEAIHARLARHVAKIEPHIDAYFAQKPAAPYGVARLDPSLEGAMTFGYYKRPEPDDPRGLYYFNGSKPDQRNLLFGLALMAHELVPGHHFQIARQEESASLHPLRRENFDTAFVEGWGEYSAALGLDMGIYDDPYDRAGRLMMDMMLSSRLVVDTGMNALGWTREQAMQYLREHSMMSETEIATETLRYSADIPAQALAYKIGSLRMIALRKRAQERLGPRFDIRQFHEWILANGSMPLQVLEQHVEEKTQ
jgi:uncharacterized protein (DUF885 family)